MDIWYFDSTHTEKLTTVNELPQEGFIWIDAQPDEVNDIIELAQALTKTTVNERHIHDCLNRHHPCFYDSTLGYDILIFRSVVSDHLNAQIHTAPVAFLIFNNLLVSFNNKDSAISRIKERFEGLRKRIPHDPFSLLYLILNEIVDNFLELRGKLIDTYSYWQNQLFSHTKHPLNWSQFLLFKTEVRKLRILSEEQQDVIHQWRQDIEVGISEQMAVRFNDLAEHIRRILRYTTQLENELDTLTQLHYSLISNRTNEVVRILTVISGIFLPLSLITGIFGWNFTHMQTVFNNRFAPGITLFGMACLGWGLFLFFKKKKWI